MPFWGTNPEPPGDPDNGRFDRYAEVGRSFLRLAALADCDEVLIVPTAALNWSSLYVSDAAVAAHRSGSTGL